MTPEQLLLEEVRDWVGTSPDDAAVLVASQRFAGQDNRAYRTALSILERREADVEADSSSFAVAGDYSESTNRAATLKVLGGRIARLRALLGIEASGLPSITAGRLAGPGNHR